MRVDDDLAASEASVAVGSADDEAARGVEEVLGVLVDVLLRNYRADDVLLEISLNLLVADAVGVLRGDEDSVDALGDRDAIDFLVLDGDLRLAVRPNPGHDALLAHFGEACAELGGHQVRKGHTSSVSSVAYPNMMPWSPAPISSTDLPMWTPWAMSGDCSSMATITLAVL